MIETRSHVVARIADRYTAPLGSRDVIGHVTIWYPVCHFQILLMVELWNGVSYLQPFSRYCALSVSWSGVWPIMVTWRHRSRDHLIPIGHFICYWWPFGTKPLSLTVFEIFNVECDLHCMHFQCHSLCPPYSKYSTVSFAYFVRSPVLCRCTFCTKNLLFPVNVIFCLFFSDNPSSF